MMQIVLTFTVFIIVLGTIGWVWANNRFKVKLDTIEQHLKRAPSQAMARHDLPPEIMMLTKMMGTQSRTPRSYVRLRQAGEMWMAPGARPQRFTAQQIIASTEPGFLWRARTVPFAFIVVADYYVENLGGLEVRLTGAVALACEVGTADVDRGEMLRYLAELPLNPDAILYNHTLEWDVIDPQTFTVASSVGGVYAKITFTLGSDGLIDTARAESRPYTDGKQRLDRPWHGRFWNYSHYEGYLIPTEAEAVWVLDGKDFIYWHGKITEWAAR